VYDMYRTIVNGGHYELAEKFFTKEYIQHNPNVASGRDALVAYIKQTRPQRPLVATISFPLISIVAEGDMVVVATVSTENDPDKPGQKYDTTHFDMYRIQNGLIAEHWDHVPKSKAALNFDPNTTIRK
jgi:predicted SnoaL-like aldol condensation-catalyzing enzyme